MNVGSAIAAVGGAVIWLWGIATPGISFATLAACMIGGMLMGVGLATIFAGR